MHTKSLVYDHFYNSSDLVCHIVDKDGIVRFINKAYLKILGKEEDQVIGHPIVEITPDTRTLGVLNTGKAIIGYNWTINGYNMIASCVPLIKDGEMVGTFAYSVFMDIWDARNTVDILMTELNMYKDEVLNIYSSRYNFEQIIGQTKAISEVKNLAYKAALHPSITVLINGESGTGKELIAHAIHGASSRARMPFVRVNCAAIPENLLEAELFGYEEGAFTGARKGGSTGKFELANGGTIFLDEVGEMSLAMQSKLLVFLQDKEFEKVGSNKPIRVNVRVVAATNRNLPQMISEHKFREDLFYRLNVLSLDVPALRERKEDLPMLVKYLIPNLDKDLKTKVKCISPAALESLFRYDWPGNIRELINILQRAMLLADLSGCQIITEEHLPTFKSGAGCRPPVSCQTLKEMTRDFEKDVMAKVLAKTNFNKAKTAEILDIDLSWLYRKIKQYGLCEKC